MFECLGVNSKFYPEQLDISFDFTSRMCNNQFCDLCPFGKGSFKLCFEGDNQEKSCPVSLFTCGYRSPCNSTDCPIVKGIGIETCGFFQIINS